jgi:cell division protein FtsX
MIIFISLILLFVLGIALLCKNQNESLEVTTIILTIFSGIFLIVSSISLVTNSIEVRSDINKFIATETTIEIARKVGVDVENTAIQHKIIESNQWLAKQQYLNSTIFELWIPDEIDKLKPIR